MEDRAFYARVGSTEQIRGVARLMPADHIEMQGSQSAMTDIAQADGTWLKDPLKEWEDALRISDALMSRAIEELWEVVGIEHAPRYTQTKYNEKKALRLNKPTTEVSNDK